MSHTRRWPLFFVLLICLVAAMAFAATAVPGQPTLSRGAATIVHVADDGTLVLPAGITLVADQHLNGRLTAKRTTYVYITDTGEKYHRAGCRYLKYSKHRVTLKWAKKNGYTPCKVCKPPR